MPSALVTGASSGIGAAFARALAAGIPTASKRSPDPCRLMANPLTRSAIRRVQRRR